jgi:general secretion pathway protein I
MRRGAGRGFTLLEILVALAIMSIVVLSFLRGNALMIANADYLREKSLAGWVAMNRAAELRLAGQWLNESGAEGTALMGDRTWRWRATGKASPDPEMQIVTIEVRAAEGQGNTPLASLTMFLGPLTRATP